MQFKVISSEDYISQAAEERKNAITNFRPQLKRTYQKVLKKVFNME